MSIFAGFAPVPPDAIMGIAEEFNRDPRPDKVSLAAGVFVDETGITPVLTTVSEAEARILAAQTTKLYKPVAGDPAYLRPVRDLVFDDRVAQLYLGPTLTARLRARLEKVA